MFIYDKKLQYPVKIDKPNPRLAAIIISQYGGPDGELGASLRYLSQRYSMPFDELKGLLTDIGTSATIWHPSEKNIGCNVSSMISLCHRVLAWLESDPDARLFYYAEEKSRKISRAAQTGGSCG